MNLENTIILLAAVLACTVIIILVGAYYYASDVAKYEARINKMLKEHNEDIDVWQTSLIRVKQDRNIMLSFWTYHYENIIERFNDNDYPVIPDEKADKRYKSIVSEIKKLIDSKKLTTVQTRNLAHVLLDAGLLNHEISEDRDV